MIHPVYIQNQNFIYSSRSSFFILLIVLGDSETFNRSIPRGIRPRFTCQQDGFNDFEQSFINEISYRIVNEQQRLTVIYPITAVACSFLNSTIITNKNRSISIEQIINDKNTLFMENNNILEYYFSSNYQIFWPSTNEKINLEQRLILLYSDIFELIGNNHLRLKMTDNYAINASLLMKLIMYRNTCLHLFSKPAYILLACKTNSQVRRTHKIFTCHYFHVDKTEKIDYFL